MRRVFYYPNYLVTAMTLSDAIIRNFDTAVNYPRRKRKSAEHERHQPAERERFEPKADRQLKKIFSGIGTPPAVSFHP